MDNVISNTEDIPKWMTVGKTVLCQKDPSKGNAVDNYRPISCLPLMWKLMTGIIAESIYNFLHVNDKLPVEQKGCRKKSSGTEDQLLIDKRYCVTVGRDTNLGMAWIDYKKAYDMVPHFWILESLELVQVSDNILKFVKRSMANWQTELTSCGESLAKVNIRRGISQGDSLSPLLFVICMILLTHVICKAKARYTLGGGVKINHPLFMDDLKLYGKSENEIKGLVSTVDFSQDIGMEFGIKKCGVIIMNRGKVKSTDGIELPSGEKIREIEEGGYKYLGILEYDRVKEQEMKDKFRNQYFRRTNLILKIKLNGRNKIMALNTWAVSILRYGAGIPKWNKNELQEMDRNTRKFMTMNKELHPRSDVARLYVSRKNGGRGLIACENSVKSEENGLGWYIKNNIEPLLAAVRTSRTITHEKQLTLKNPEN